MLSFLGTFVVVSVLIAIIRGVSLAYVFDGESGDALREAIRRDNPTASDERVAELAAEAEKEKRVGITILSGVASVVLMLMWTYAFSWFMGLVILVAALAGGVYLSSAVESRVRRIIPNLRAALKQLQQ